MSVANPSTLRCETMLLVACIFVTTTGCIGSNRSIPIPRISPSKAAAEATEQYDGNQDGTLSRRELEACPGMLAAFALYDSDSNDAISGQEIEERLAKWQKAKIAIVSLSCKVTLDGRPLTGASVKLVPESYLGGQVNEANGKTGQRGTAVVSISREVLPAGAKEFRGVNYGTYRVLITHPTITLPEKYQEPSTLGHEVAPDFGTPYATFDLTS